MPHSNNGPKAVLVLPAEHYIGPVSGVPVPSTSTCVHQGWLRLHQGKRIRAWIKAYTPLATGQEPRDLINEIIGHHLAKAWGYALPPHAGVLILPRDLCAHLPVWNHYPQETESLSTWWSEHVPSRSLASRYRLDVLQSHAHLHAAAYANMQQELRAATTIPEIVAFDEIIANVDRNPGNLLGSAPRYLLIDHGQCLTGPQWQAQDLDATKTYRNALKQLINWHTLPLAQMNTARHVFDRIEPTLTETLDSLRKELTGIMLPADIDTVLAFIKPRANSKTAAKRLGLIA